jgi:hypothetical protein
MGFDSTQVSSAITGAVSKITAETIITSADQDISGAGTINYGFAGSGGVTITTDVTTNNIVAWQYASVVRVTTGEASTSYTFTLLQNSKEARELYYGAEEVGGKILYKPSATTKGRFVIDYIDSEWGGTGDVLYGRHVINKGQVTSRGDIVLVNGEAIGYEVTITAFPDEDGVCAEIFHGNGTVTTSTVDPEYAV